MRVHLQLLLRETSFTPIFRQNAVQLQERRLILNLGVQCLITGGSKGFWMRERRRFWLRKRLKPKSKAKQQPVAPKNKLGKKRKVRPVLVIKRRKAFVMAKLSLRIGSTISSQSQKQTTRYPRKLRSNAKSMFTKRLRRPAKRRRLQKIFKGSRT